MILIDQGLQHWACRWAWMVTEWSTWLVLSAEEA